MFQENKILETSHCQETYTKRNIKGCSSGRKRTIRDQNLGLHDEMKISENGTTKVNKFFPYFNCYKIINSIK